MTSQGRDPIKPADLVHLIVWHAVERGHVLTAVRVVKFLFLADLYHARAHEGATLTGWPWAFVHYGPYCTEALKALDESSRQSLIEAIPYSSRYTDEERFIFKCDRNRAPILENRLPNEVALPLRRAVMRWGDDTSGLLDHVYFETEPMVRARPGDRLNFTLAERPTPPQPRPEPRSLSKENLRRAQALVNTLRERVEGELRQQRSKWPSVLDDPESRTALREIDAAATLEPIEIVADLGNLVPEPEDED